MLARLDLDALSYELRHRAGNDASQQRKNEALKRLQVVESFLSLIHIYASKVCDTFEEAIDLDVEALEKQLVKYKEKQRSK